MNRIDTDFRKIERGELGAAAVFRGQDDWRSGRKAQPFNARTAGPARAVDMALTEIVFLLVVIIANAVLFWRIDRLAGVLFVPYLLWVAYAIALNASLWLLNST